VSKKYRPDKEEYIEGIGQFLYNIKIPSFDKSLEALADMDASIPSTRDFVYSITKTKKEIYGPVKEAIISYPGEGNLLIRNSLIIEFKELAEAGARAHEQGRELYLEGEYGEKANKLLEIAKKESPNDEAIFLRNNFPIQVQRFNEDKRINWMFKDTKEELANILCKKDIRAISFYVDSKDEVNRHTKPYINQLWLSLFSKDQSGFLGNYKFLHTPISIHAIKNKVIIP